MTKLTLELTERDLLKNIQSLKPKRKKLFFIIHPKKSPIGKIKRSITDSQYKGWFLLACATDEPKLNSE